MAVTTEQAAALEKLNTVMPEDLVPGYSADKNAEPPFSSPFLTALRDLGKLFDSAASANFNLSPRADKPKANPNSPRLVLSAEGFPSWVTVSYAGAPPLSYQSQSGARDVKHVVLHSFGHSWHAKDLGAARGWGGWLNSWDAGQGVEPYEVDGETVYIPKGSLGSTLTHLDRVKSATQAAIGPYSRTTPHFMIDRVGNLLVVGDVNNSTYMANAANESAVSIALEEAFYLVKHPNEEKAVWDPEGSPPGTGGNIQYFSFTSVQLLTLAILCKKLEVSFPSLAGGGSVQGRNVDFSRRSLTKDSAAGYTMHDFIKESDFPDVSPHFLTTSLWSAFFDVVDKQTHITTDRVWKAPPKFIDPTEELVAAPIADTPVTGVSEQILGNLKYECLGYYRSLNTINEGSNYSEAGNRAHDDANRFKQIAANTASIIQQVEYTPMTLLPEDYPEEDQGGVSDVWSEEYL